MKKLVLLSVLVITACSNISTLHPTANRSDVKVIMVWDTQPHVKKICSTLGSWGGKMPPENLSVGCNSYVESENTCVVYATKPVSLDDKFTEILGHEVYHCFSGKYHDE